MRVPVIALGIGGVSLPLLLFVPVDVRPEARGEAMTSDRNLFCF
jgi:hypothetical protein